MGLKTIFSCFSKLKSTSTASQLLRKQTSLCSCKIHCTSAFSTTYYSPFRSNYEINSNGFNQSKANIILSLNFKSPDDCLPFYKLPMKQLIKIRNITKNDEQKNFCENRLYYISSKIQCSPALLSIQLAKRTFVYDLSFEWLEKSLNALLEKGVTGDRILRDLWVLKYHHETISERLQQVKDMGVDVLYPWMVRCTPAILNRYINLTKETKHILGESKSSQMYLAKRLNISMEDVEAICSKLPGLRTMRVTKIKKFVDFLIDEGFCVEEIAEKPRILSSSQNTIKHRLESLRSLGQNVNNLNILCRSRKSFQKYYEALKTTKNLAGNNSSGGEEVDI